MQDEFRMTRQSSASGHWCLHEGSSVLCTGGNLLVPGAPCAFGQEAAAGSTCVGCQQAELGTQLPPGLFTAPMWDSQWHTERCCEVGHVKNCDSVIMQ